MYTADNPKIRFYSYLETLGSLVEACYHVTVENIVSRLVEKDQIVFVPLDPRDVNYDAIMGDIHES